MTSSVGRAESEIAKISLWMVDIFHPVIGIGQLDISKVLQTKSKTSMLIRNILNVFIFMQCMLWLDRSHARRRVDLLVLITTGSIGKTKSTNLAHTLPSSNQSSRLVSTHVDAEPTFLCQDKPIKLILLGEEYNHRSLFNQIVVLPC